MNVDTEARLKQGATDIEAAWSGSAIRHSLDVSEDLLSPAVEIAAYKLFRWDAMFGTVSGDRKDYITKALLVAEVLGTTPGQARSDAGRG